MMRRWPRFRSTASRALSTLAAAVLFLALAAAPALLPQAYAASVQREILPNGMRVLYLENHSRPLIGVCIVVNGGSRTETPDLSGLSHYYEHLIFRGGSQKQAELEFRKEMQRIGEESGGYTTNDYTCYGFTAPVDHFDEALWRSVDAWMGLKLTSAKVAKERQVVMSEYNQGEDRPDYKVYYQIERLMFHDHPYKRDTIGLKDVIEGASLATFRTFYAERYVPNQMTLAVVGDFDTPAMRAKIEKSFLPYKRGRAGFEQGLVEKPQTAFRMGVERMKTPSTQFYLGFHVPPYSDPDAPAYTVLGSLLGRGTSSRLYRALKERENVVTSVDADFEVRKDPGMFLIGVELPPENEAKAFGIIRDELRRLALEKVPADELDRVKSALLNRYAFAAQTVFDRAERLCLFALMSDVSLEATWPKLLSAVTAEDIQRLARKTFAADQASYSVVRPAGTAGPSDDSIQAMVREWGADWPGGSGTTQAAVSSPPRREVLPNGVTLILREDHSSPIVAVSTIARGGQWIEPEGRSGVSHMAALLMRRGAGSLSAREISDRADRLGMVLSTFGTPDYAAVTWQVPSRNLDAAWSLYSDVLLRPTFPASEVGKVRQDLVQRVKSLGDRPFDYTNLRFEEALYRKSPYRRFVGGDTVSLARIQVSDLKRAYERMFCGANLVVSVVGDFDTPTLLAAAKKSLGVAPRGKAVEVGGLPEAGPSEQVVRFEDKDQQQVTYNTGWLACSVRDPDYVPLRVVTSLIGDRLFFKYVYEKGVAYRSWFYMVDRMGQTSVQNEMGVTPADFPGTSSEVLDDIAAVVKGPITETQLKTTVEKMLTRYTLAVEENAAMAQRLCFDEAAGLGYEFADRYPERVRKVTVEQAQEIARKYLAAGRYTRVAVGREPHAEPASKPASR